MEILIPLDGESWSALSSRLKKISGQVLLVLGKAHTDDAHSSEFHAFLRSCREREEVIVATRISSISHAAAAHDLVTVTKVPDLKELLGQDHPRLSEVLQVFAPSMFRQQMRSHLQTMGLLSLPKLRIIILASVSGILFFFVLFRLLPSAEIRVWAREDTITQTANIFLVMSGATVDIPERVRRMELVPMTINVDKTITFDQISKEFDGEHARVVMTIHNNASESYALKKGSRMTNQAGMIFRLQESIFIDTGQEVLTEVVADDIDLYGEIIGERGNVPAGLTWEFPGLPVAERRLVYGKNQEPGFGGTTSYRKVLSRADIDVAQAQLKEELLTSAKQLIDEQRVLINAEDKSKVLEMLYYEELTKSEYIDFVLPEVFLDQPVQSVPIEGTIRYTSYAYDTQEVLDLLYKELVTHVGQDKVLLEDSISLDRLVAHVIDYHDDLLWIKLTVDLSGTQRYVLDPLSPMGARFGKRVRNEILGLSTSEAKRVIKNLPEVDEVSISLWPPWSRIIPSIPSHISIVPST